MEIECLIVFITKIICILNFNSNFQSQFVFLINFQDAKIIQDVNPFDELKELGSDFECGTDNPMKMFVEAEVDPSKVLGENADNKEIWDADIESIDSDAMPDQETVDEFSDNKKSPGIKPGKGYTLSASLQFLDDRSEPCKLRLLIVGVEYLCDELQCPDNNAHISAPFLVFLFSR